MYSIYPFHCNNRRSRKTKLKQWELKYICNEMYHSLVTVLIFQAICQLLYSSVTRARSPAELDEQRYTWRRGDAGARRWWGQWTWWWRWRAGTCPVSWWCLCQAPGPGDKEDGSNLTLPDLSQMQAIKIGGNQTHFMYERRTNKHWWMLSRFFNWTSWKA